MAAEVAAGVATGADEVAISLLVILLVLPVVVVVVVVVNFVIPDAGGAEDDVSPVVGIEAGCGCVGITAAKDGWGSVGVGGIGVGAVAAAAGVGRDCGCCCFPRRCFSRSENLKRSCGRGAISSRLSHHASPRVVVPSVPI